MSSAPPPPSAVALLRVLWEQAIAEVHDGLIDSGFEDIRPGHRIILRDLLTAGLRPTDLATRLGVSKQAANDILREFENGGYITLLPDPADRRSKRIHATERGTALVAAASQTSADIVDRWSAQVGPRRFAQFQAVLAELTDETAP